MNHMNEHDTVEVQKLRPDDVYDYLESHQDGLSEAEVQVRLNQYGKNVLKEVEGEPLWKSFLHHFTSLMAILLWIAGIFAIVAEMRQLGIAIWAVNVINGVFSFGKSFKPVKLLTR